MPLTTAFDLAFVAGIAVAVLALAGAALRFLSRTALLALVALELVGAVAAWVVFALEQTRERELAVSAAGITGCMLAAAAALLLQRALQRSEEIDTQMEKARASLRALVDREAEERAAELERTLARARAESVSLLDRRGAKDRRRSPSRVRGARAAVRARR